MHPQTSLLNFIFLKASFFIQMIFVKQTSEGAAAAVLVGIRRIQTRPSSRAALAQEHNSRSFSACVSYVFQGSETRTLKTLCAIIRQKI